MSVFILGNNGDYKEETRTNVNEGGYPAKLKKVLIVTAPLWFKAPFKILRLFVREKLRDRVYTVSIPQGSNEAINDHANAVESEGEDFSISKTGNKNSQSWQCSSSNLEGKTSPQPASASSGFSDDDSLHGDSSQGLTIEQFIEKVLEKGRNGLVSEYLEIKARPPDGTFNESRLRNNTGKNRYTDVLCYDHSRVVLSQIDDDPASSYINANFVDGYKQKNAFISTQGPLPKTCTDFWRMVWEQHVLVIVMTTKVMERSRPKCHQYWPEEEISEELLFGPFRITNYSVEKFTDYIITGLQVTNLDTDEMRDVTHYLYTSWPDYGIPPTAVGMLDFLYKVRQGQARMLKELEDKWAGHSRGPPIIVHCSAGIGRTGTFCTLDICISRLEDVGLINVRDTVEKIRSQRAYSIQMPDQYIFCHLALIEYAARKGLIDELPDLSAFDLPQEDDSE